MAAAAATTTRKHIVDTVLLLLRAHCTLTSALSQFVAQRASLWHHHHRCELRNRFGTQFRAEQEGVAAVSDTQSSSRVGVSRSRVDFVSS